MQAGHREKLPWRNKMHVVCLACLQLPERIEGPLTDGLLTAVLGTGPGRNRQLSVRSLALLSDQHADAEWPWTSLSVDTVDVSMVMRLPNPGSKERSAGCVTVDVLAPLACQVCTHVYAYVHCTFTEHTHTHTHTANTPCSASTCAIPCTILANHGQGDKARNVCVVVCVCVRVCVCVCDRLTKTVWRTSNGCPRMA